MGGREKEWKLNSFKNSYKELFLLLKKTTETACLAYADAFVAVAASLSCSEFSQAAEDFSAAAKEYANGKGNNDVIVGAISSMAYDEFEKEFKKVKIFANNEGDKLNKMTAAIDKLCAVYKRVMS